MKKIKVGINGMGRIGKNLCRGITQDLQDYFDIVAANDIVSAEAIAQSFKRDSVHGRFPVEVKLLSDDEMQLGPNRVKLFAEQDATNIPWGALRNSTDLPIRSSMVFFDVSTSRRSWCVPSSVRGVWLTPWDWME